MRTLNVRPQLLLAFFTLLLGLSTASYLDYPIESPAPSLSVAPAPRPSASRVCNCSSPLIIKAPLPAGAPYICQDSRLGPIVLPTKLPLSGFLTSYDRFGGLTPGEFLAKWTVNGSYVYPPIDGFQLDINGVAINGTMLLEAGTLVDRFGSEYGTYISAADAPYSQRALPPNNLDTNPSAPDFPYNYHLYEVLKPLEVVGGPIAPWFGQQGLGAQFYTGGVGDILTLLAEGYLTRLDPTTLVETYENDC